MKKNIDRFVRKITSTSRKALSAFVATGTLLMPTISRADFNGYTGMTSDSIMHGFWLLLGTLGTFAGAFYTGTSVWAYIAAKKSEDPEAQHKASMGFIPGIAFLSLGSILLLFQV